MKFTHLTRITFLLAIFFALDKGLAILRQVIIGRIFGLSADLDAFNAANNVPDLLFALISGGALAIAFLPVLSEVLTKEGKASTWRLFSQVANLAFLVTAFLAVIVAVKARALVSWSLGVAPGFNPAQQELVARLMQLNLVATLIFSISGLVMAGLQANQHFFLPALAPLLYNLGQIMGALILAPEKGLSFGPIHLPAFGMGVYGLVYGVIIGAVLHLAVQIPGLLKYQFRWSPSLGLNAPEVRQVLRLIGPRLLTMLCIQITFIARDNLASRIGQGAVSALTYGWMIMQVPETLIGTAIGTALLPTLAEQIARGDYAAFKASIERAARVLLALTLPAAAVVALGIRPLIGFAFKFDATGTDMVAWATVAYLAGLVGHSLLELMARSFYAQQKALMPFLAALANTVFFILLAGVMMQFGPAGIALANSVAFTSEALLLWFLLNRRLPQPVQAGGAFLRGFAGLLTAGVVVFAVSRAPFPSAIPLSIAAMAAGTLAAIPWVWKELQLLLHL